MSTLPPERPVQPHQVRRVAESFGTEAERYDRERPRYPDALVKRIVDASPGREFLDVGTGTGIAARQFIAAGRDVLGIEPDERMAGLARQAGVKVEIGKFEDWDDAGRRFDAVVAGMAWHWVDPVAGAAKAARVLRPGGRIALFWYVMQPPDELRESFKEVYRRVLSDSPFVRNALPTLEAYSVIFDRAEAGIAEADAFGPPERWRFDWERRFTRDQWLEGVHTFGGFSRIPAADQASLLAGLGDAVDAAGGSFTARYPTVVVTTTRS
jgi:SAM-dependent methyltransferase